MGLNTRIIAPKIVDSETTVFQKTVTETTTTTKTTNTKSHSEYNLVTPAPMAVEAAKSILDSSVSPYYKDTISSYHDDLQAAASQQSFKGTSSILEEKIEQLSNDIDIELKKYNRNFEKLQELVYKVISAMMHRAKQVDQEYISETGADIKIQAVKVQGTYNAWPGLVITVISSGISVAGGAAGLSPMVSWINPETAKVFQGASQSIATAGTGLGGVGSIFNNKGEGTRYVYQIMLEETKKKREDRESSRQQKSTCKNEAMGQWRDHLREVHQVVGTVLGQG